MGRAAVFIIIAITFYVLAPVLKNKPNEHSARSSAELATILASTHQFPVRDNTATRMQSTSLYTSKLYIFSFESVVFTRA